VIAMKKIMRVSERFNRLILNPYFKNNFFICLFRFFRWYSYKFLNKSEVVIRIFNSSILEIKVDSLSRLGIHGYTFIYRGMLDPLVPYSIDKYISDGDYVLDIGANFGLWSFRMSELVGERGKVFSFEPLTKNIELFKRNLTLNNYANIVLHECGLGNENKELTIYEGFDLGSTSLIKTDNLKFTGFTQDILIKRLDEFTFDKPISFVKLDVEGFEMYVLSGMKSFLLHNRPIFAIEINEQQLLGSGFIPMDILIFFKNYQYKLYKLSEDVEVEIEAFEDDGDYLLKPTNFLNI
jgi:FkbM family methyltransferase